MSESAPLWVEVKDVFRRWTGMNLPEAVRSRALELLDRSAEGMGCPPAHYLHQLDDDREARQLFMDHLGLGTTWFMRDPEGLHSLVDTLSSYGPKSRVLTLWSVGCSTGEEPYSLAMSLAAAGLRARILATDLNRAALDTARARTYPAASLERIPQEWRTRYFRSAAGASIQLVDRIYKMVTFRLHNLQDNQPPPMGWSTFDAIICRNVLIYFDRERALAIIERLASFCTPGGYLLLGAIERPLFWMSRSRLPTDTAESAESAEAKDNDGQISDRTSMAGELVQVLERPPPASSKAARSHRGSNGVDAPPAPPRAETANPCPPPPRSAGAERRERIPILSTGSRRPRRRNGVITQLGIQRLLEKAEVAAQEQRHDEALELVEEARRRAPLEPSIHLQHGHILMSRGDLSRAIDSFRSSRFLGRDGWMAPYLLARCLESTGEVEEAVEAYRYALGVLQSAGGSGYYRHDPDVEGMAPTTTESCLRRIRELEA